MSGGEHTDWPHGTGPPPTVPLLVAPELLVPPLAAASEPPLAAASDAPPPPSSVDADEGLSTDSPPQAAAAAIAIPPRSKMPRILALFTLRLILRQWAVGSSRDQVSALFFRRYAHHLPPQCPP
jgi:hypothetical protein